MGMSTLQIDVTDDVRSRLAARAAENGFRTPEEFVKSMIIAETDEAQIDDDLEELLLRRLDSGPSITVTPEFIAQFKRETAECIRSAGLAK